VTTSTGSHTRWVNLPCRATTSTCGCCTDSVSRPPRPRTASASRVTEGGTLDLSTRYRMSPTAELGGRVAFRLEENFRSWMIGAAGARSFADDNTTIAVSAHQVLDWLDTYDHRGVRQGRAYRSTTNVNLTLTQLLSPTTVAALSYGGSLQLGELSNTWNAVPRADGMMVTELLPRLRHRHALAARLAQALPWRGVLKGSYRFYVDDWGIRAHSIEAQLYQRAGRYVWMRVNYRVHHQTAASFWTAEVPDDEARFRTADSDLQRFVSQTFGGMISVDVPLRRSVLRDLHVDFGYDRYVRTNSLHADLYTCALGFLF
jgi:hypothetical protein